MKAFLLQWVDEDDEPDDAYTAVVLAHSDESAESAIYRHHVASDSYMRGTVRHWLWREVPIINASTAPGMKDPRQSVQEKTPYDVTEPTRKK